MIEFLLIAVMAPLMFLLIGFVYFAVAVITYELFEPARRFYPKWFAEVCRRAF